MRRPEPHSSIHTPAQIIALFLSAYRSGIFPMAEIPETDHDPAAGPPVAAEIGWYSPDPRAVLPLHPGGLHVGHTLARTVRRAPFTLTSDRAFDRVIRACARPGPARGALWLDETLIRCYNLLHHEGHAHSIEAWRPSGAGVPTHHSGDSPEVAVSRPPIQGYSKDGGDLELVGGIYGVSIGAAFFAESMFTNIDAGGSGASSVCLITLWNHLRACGYTLLDVQIANDHTDRFGVIEIPRDEYHTQLAAAIQGPDRWRPLNPQP